MSIDVIHMARFMAPCGVSTYTEQLVAALKEQRVTQLVVASSYGWKDRKRPQRKEAAPEAALVTWDEHGDIGSAATALREYAPRLVHVQHEFGIFRSPEALAGLIASLRVETDIRFVVTLHSVPQRGSKAVDMLMASMPHAVIVHSKAAQRALEASSRRWQVPVFVVAHGMLPPQNTEARNAARRQLKLPNDALVMMTLGFIAKSKKPLTVISGLAAAIRQGSISKRRVQYVIAGKPMGGDGFALVEGLRRLVSNRGLGDVVRIEPRFVPFDELPVYYGAADMAVHANAAGPFSSSGSVRMDFSFGMPVVAQRVQLTADLPGAVAAFYDNDAALASTLSMVATNKEYRNKLSTAARRFANQNSWDRIARMHIRLYERVLRAPLRQKGWRKIWRALLQTRLPSRGVA